jgi:hypothetical protein
VLGVEKPAETGTPASEKKPKKGAGAGPAKRAAKTPSKVESKVGGGKSSRSGAGAGSVDRASAADKPTQGSSASPNKITGRRSPI